MEPQLNEDHYMLLRIMALRRRRSPENHYPSHAINKLTFIMFGVTPDSESDKEYVRNLLNDMKKSGITDTRYIKTKEDPGGVYKWTVTNKGYKYIETQWKEFYNRVKKKEVK